MSEEKYINIFRQVYNGENIEEVMKTLRDSGAWQVDTIKVLMHELSISLTDADHLILNSIAWKDLKEATIAVRNSFADSIDYLQNIN